MVLLILAENWGLTKTVSNWTMQLVRLAQVTVKIQNIWTVTVPQHKVKKLELICNSKNVERCVHF